MTPNAQDPLQVLLCKAAYWAKAAAGAGPFPSGMYPSMTPNAQDPLQVLAAKLAYWLQQVAGGGGGGGGGGLAFSTGAVAPEGVVIGSPGDTYWDTVTGFYYVKVTGVATNTGWQVH